MKKIKKAYKKPVPPAAEEAKKEWLSIPTINRYLSNKVLRTSDISKRKLPVRTIQILQTYAIAVSYVAEVCEATVYQIDLR